MLLLWLFFVFSLLFYCKWGKIIKILGQSVTASQEKAYDSSPRLRP